ncbi:MAG: T9SS type A sorting domain-containing protein, partial [Bacteroidales bacterium]|nr:T9SS type A sorting domain-containing protein [Bacteroidales bacterium]
EISQASYGGGQMEVTYFVPSAPANSTYPIRVEFFRTNTNERQGKTFLGFDEFTVADHTAGTKTASFSVAPELGFEIGNQITATATDADGNTSHFGTLVTSQPGQIFYTISASAGLGGTIEPLGETEVAEGGSQLYVISPDTGFEIVDVLVDGSSVGAVASYLFEGVINNRTIHATFQKQTFTIVASAGTGGSIDPVGDVVVEYGENQSFTITADTGYEIDDVLVDGASIGAQPSHTFENVMDDHTIVASFKKLTFTIAASAGTGGSIDPVGDVVVEYGENQSFVITADAGYEIADVLVDNVSVGAMASYTFQNVTANHTIEAQFSMLAPELYTLTLQVNPMGAGAVSGGGSFEEGQLVTVSASANAGYNFVNWTRGGVEVSAVADFSYEMPAENVTLVANFIKQTFTILASAGTGGSIDPVGNVVVEYGESQLFTITADSGYEIADVLVDGVSVGAVTSHTFTNVMANHTIEAQFEMLTLETFSLTLLAYPEDGGMVYGAGEYEAGAMINVSALANAGYRFLDWSRDGQFVSGMSAFVFTMPAMDVTLVANFEEAMGVYCTFSQGYWFAKGDVVWPYDVVVGGHTFTQAQGQQFWPSNTPTQRGFTQYATIYLSGVTLSEFPELAAAMQVIDHYFATTYPAPAGHDVNRAAGYIGKWIDENHCVVTLQGIAEFDTTGQPEQEVAFSDQINAKAYPNPFRKEATIEFMVHENVHTTVKVYNLVGERMSVLFEGPVQAFETHILSFDGKDLQSGFYFYRIEAGSQVHVGRLVMIK